MAGLEPPLPGAVPALERGFRRALIATGALAALGLAVQGAIAAWSSHEFTQVESIVAMHVNMLVAGEGIYHDLNRYPFTVSPYMPLFYHAAAALHWLGMDSLLAGRLLTMAAFAGILWLSYRILSLYTAGTPGTGGRFAVWTGVVLMACNSNLVTWGTVNQVDTTGLFFSLAAIDQYSRYQPGGSSRSLVWCGMFVVLALMTKQTMVAAGGSITLLLLWRDWRRGAAFGASVAAAACAIVLAWNFATGGRFLDNTVLSNINPMAGFKLSLQAEYLLRVAGGLLLVAAVGLPRGLRERCPLMFHLIFAAAVFAATAPKIGSDANYQIETMAAATLCAAWTLHRLEFFPRYFRRGRELTTLLHIPLAVAAVVNLTVTGTQVRRRIGEELERRAETEALRPYLAPGPGRVLSASSDAARAIHGRMDVEPLIFTLLAEAGVADPTPVRRDLAAGNFRTVILFHDIFGSAGHGGGAQEVEIPRLPAPLLEEMRKHYRLVRHVPGPLLNGNYVYQPVRAR